MLSPESATFLSQCLSDIQEHTQGIIPEPVDLSDSDAETGVMYVNYDCLGLLERGARHTSTPPTTKIVRMILELAGHPNAMPAIEEVSDEDAVPETEDYETALDAIGCLEAEPRLAHSLAKQSTRQSERYPACILYDSAGEPFAYQKGNGAPLAVTWKDGYLNTDEGLQWVPQNSIIRALYNNGYNPRAIHPNRSLIAIRSPNIREAHFLRFTTASWLPTALAYEAAKAGNERAGTLRVADVEEASVLTSQRLGEKVLPLLDWAHVIDH